MGAGGLLTARPAPPKKRRRKRPPLASAPASRRERSRRAWSSGTGARRGPPATTRSWAYLSEVNTPFDIDMYIRLPARVTLSSRRNLCFEFTDLRGDHLHFFHSPRKKSSTMPEMAGPVGVRQATPDLLGEFRELQNAQDNVIRYFAEKWGVLRINGRGQFRSAVMKGTEPPEIWRQLAGRVDAILRIAADI